MVEMVHRFKVIDRAGANCVQLVEALVAELVKKVNEVAKLVVVVAPLYQDERHFAALQENFEILHRTC